MNPKKLFLIDGFGAILSALLIGIVLVKYERIIGIPASTLYLLSALPLLFAAYDFSCYFKSHWKTGLLLQGIAFLNLLYCALSLGLAFYHYQSIRILGWTYILCETLIILLLAIIEFKMGKRIIKMGTEEH